MITHREEEGHSSHCSRVESGREGMKLAECLGLQQIEGMNKMMASSKAEMLWSVLSEP